MDGKDTTFCLFVCLPYGPEGGPRLWWRGVAIPNGKALNHCRKQAFFSGGELSLALEMGGLGPSCLGTASHVRFTWRTVCSKFSLIPRFLCSHRRNMSKLPYALDCRSLGLLWAMLP